MLYASFICVLASLGLVQAHSWIEQMMVINPNGTFVGNPGYARGNVLRSTPGFNDNLMVNLIPPNGGPINVIAQNQNMCRPSQQTQSQTAGSPRLQAVPGAAVVLRYQENGHVTLPQNQPGKPNNRGTMYVYGTSQPSSSDTLLAIHRVWNAEGTGGDKRGRLLSTQNFDDGQCYQINSGTISEQRQKEFPHVANTLMGADLWCQQDIMLPTDVAANQPYTLYWVWDWPTLPGTAGFPDGKQEIYTTCMDVDIVNSLPGIEAVTGGSQFAQGQSLDEAAIQSEMADISNPTAVVGQTIPFTDTGAANVPPATVAASNAPVPAPGFTTAAPAPVPEATTGSPAPVPGVNSQAPAPAPLAPSTFATQPHQTSRGGRHGGHSHGGSNPHHTSFGFLETSAAPNAPAPVPEAPQPTPVAQTNNHPDPDPTVTEFAQVTETVMRTVYSTVYAKRSGMLV